MTWKWTDDRKTSVWCESWTTPFTKSGPWLQKQDGRSLSSQWRPRDTFVGVFCLLFFRVSFSKSFRCTTVNILRGAKTIKVTHGGGAYENIRGMIQHSRQSETRKQGEEGGAHTAVLFFLLPLQLTLGGGVSLVQNLDVGVKSGRG